MFVHFFTMSFRTWVIIALQGFFFFTICELPGLLAKDSGVASPLFETFFPFLGWLPPKAVIISKHSIVNFLTLTYRKRQINLGLLNNLGLFDYLGLFDISTKFKPSLKLNEKGKKVRKDNRKFYYFVFLSSDEALPAIINF